MYHFKPSHRFPIRQCDTITRANVIHAMQVLFNPDKPDSLTADDVCAYIMGRGNDPHVRHRDRAARMMG